MIEKDAGPTRVSELSGGDRCDDDAADDEEEIDAKVAVTKEAEMISGEVLRFNALYVSEDDEESGKSATDLDADNSPGMRL
jgi:hypothetical protein